MAGSKKQALENLKKADGKRTGRPRRKYLTKQEVEFLSRYVYTGRFKQSAIDSGLAIGPPLYALLDKPAAVAFMEQLQKDVQEAVRQKVKEKVELTTEWLDEIVMRMLMKPKKYGLDGKGISNLVFAGFRRTKAIEPKTISASATALSAAGAALVNKQGAFEVYEAAWLTEKKAEWARQLEAKHGSDGSSATAE